MAAEKRDFVAELFYENCAERWLCEGLFIWTDLVGMALLLLGMRLVGGVIGVWDGGLA